MKPKAMKFSKKVDENLTPVSYESYRKLINEEPDGSKKEFIFFTVKKGKDKVAMLYISPASEKGRATLRLGDNMWLYIPNVGRPIRITSMQSVLTDSFIRRSTTTELAPLPCIWEGFLRDFKKTPFLSKTR